MGNKKSKANTNARGCPVPKEEWDRIARGAATMVLNEVEKWDYFDKYEPEPFVFPEEACAITGFSKPTFKKYARKYLMPENYGELPEWFFDKEWINAKRLPKLKY